MTLKISYIKYIRENIRQRSWLAALSGILFFLLMPVYTLMYLDSFSYTPAELKNMVYDTFSGRISGNASIFLFGLFAIFAVTIAMTGFHYLHSKEKLDFYHSLPVKREQWFFISYVSGLLIFLVPYLLSTLLTIGVGAMKGIMDLPLVLQCFLAMARGILAFLLIYHTCILVGILTGKNVTMFLGTLVISVYPTLIFLLFPALTQSFFSTHYAGYNDGLLAKITYLCSPATLYYRTFFSESAHISTVTLLCASLVMIVLLLVLAIWLYHYFPSETAGKALAFQTTAPIFKVMITIPSSLIIGMFLQSFIGTHGTKWILILSILSAIILSLLIEFIYQQDLTMLLKGWKSSLVSLSVIAVILVIFQFDLFHYDTYLPKEEKIAKIAIRPDSFNGYFWYHDYNVSGNSNQYEFIFTKNTEAVYDLALEGIENVKEGLNSFTLYAEDSPVEDPENYISTSFCYELKNGQKIKRHYVLSYEQVYHTLGILLEDQAYKQDLFPIFHINEDEIVTIATEDLSLKHVAMDLTEQQKSELLTAYKTDILQADIDTLANKPPVGELSLSVIDSRNNPVTATNWGTAVDTMYRQTRATLQEEYPTYQVGEFFIYDNHTETLNCLEKFGYPLMKQLNPDNILNIKLYLSQDSMSNGNLNDFLPLIENSEITEEEYGTWDEGDFDQKDAEKMPRVYLVDDPEAIALITKHLYSNDTGILGRGKLDFDYADVLFKENSSTYSYRIQ